jgi:leucyl/phenylalanyl-tRNA--protein transferase
VSEQITPEMVLTAYVQGCFPMAEPDGEILWFRPDPRAILPLDRFRVPKSLARVVRSERFEVRIDTAFERVMRHCAAPAPKRNTTWISEDLIRLYVALHLRGFAHSVESWRAGELVGGLYGVAIRGLFAGESMFSQMTDASKVALVALVNRLDRGGYVLVDVQFMTEHLRRFGAEEIAAGEYAQRLETALGVEPDDSVWRLPRV